MESQQQTVLDAVDPEIMDHLVTRRDAIRKGLSVSSVAAVGLAMGSVPVTLAALSREAFAQQMPGDILGVLQFAFTLENLENEFYKAVLGTSAASAQNEAFAEVRGQIPAEARGSIELIQQHEQQHVDYLRGAIQSNGGSPQNFTANDFDFTGGNGTGDGPFLAATTDLDVLLLTSQAFEDTGVRAYKGQIPLLLNNSGNANADMVLEDACRIETVEGRHASRIRRIRRQRNPEITALRYSGYVLGGGLEAAGVGGLALPAEVTAALTAIYAGEEETVQVTFNGTQELRIDTANLPNTDVIGDAARKRVAAQIAFDAPLTRKQVLAIVDPFIVG